MGDNEKKVEKELKKLDASMREMPKVMRIFSLTMRSLYADKAVGTNDELAKRFRTLRDETRNDAMVYIKGILPLSTKFVSCISEYFEYYEVLNFEEWCDVIADILEETTGYRKLCEALVKMYEDFMVPLKKRRDTAMTMIDEFKDLTETYEKQSKELEGIAMDRLKWAHALFFVPGVNFVAVPLLQASASTNLVESIAKSKQAEIAEAASITVAKILIPALEAFIDGLRNTAGFFSVMEQELHKFEGKAEKAKNEPKKLYYKVMNKQAKDMKSICQGFYAVLPDVRTDFFAIPTEGTDQNYVDKWLEQQKKTIQEKCVASSLALKLLKALT
ncbi:unnamed protein product, partial [Porites lobata]